MARQFKRSASSNVVEGSIFEFDVEDIRGNQIKLNNFRGKNAYLIVNVASQCGLTNENYSQLQQLYSKYMDRGLEIIAFPCNDFGQQEPGSPEEIVCFAQSKKATFPLMGKVVVNGEDAHPLYKFLSHGSGIFGGPLEWNFTKFLCDKDGRPVKRFGPEQEPLSFEDEILEYLA